MGWYDWLSIGKIFKENFQKSSSPEGGKNESGEFF